MSEITTTALRPDGSPTRTASSDPVRAGRIFRYAAVFYLLAWGVHTADHIRRRMGPDGSAARSSQR